MNEKPTCPEEFATILDEQFCDSMLKPVDLADLSDFVRERDALIEAAAEERGRRRGLEQALDDLLDVIREMEDHPDRLVTIGRIVSGFIDAKAKRMPMEA